MKYRFALSLLLWVNFIASAENFGPGSEGVVPHFTTTVSKNHTDKCSQAVKDGGNSCYDFAASSGAVLTMPTDLVDAHILDSSKLGAIFSKKAARSGAEISTRCAKAREECIYLCGVARMNLTEKANIASRDKQWELYAEIQTDMHLADQAKRYCNVVYGEIAKQGAAAYAQANIANTKYKGTGGAVLGDDGELSEGNGKGINPWMAAGLGAAGGYMLRKENVDSKPDAASSSGASSSSGSSSGASSGTSSGASSGASSSSGSNTASSSSSGSSGSATVAAALDPDCAKTDAYTKSKCDEVTAKACAFSLTTPSCSAVADRYCGFVTTAAATTANGTAAGQGSQFCKDSLAQRFCSKGGRESCLGCRQLKDRMSPTCRANPTAAVCNPVLSTAVLTQFRAACGDDPIWTDPNYASTPSPTTRSATDMAAASGGGAFGGAVANNGAGANAQTTRTLAGADGVAYTGGSVLSVTSAGAGSGLNAASNRTYSANDITAQLGSNVVLNNSATIQAQCNAGLINNCGTRGL